ncbi:hypothetical protein INT47_007188 [Mucor saturninus]|uniref:Uncharacterized protein n=1 Tax=Mucor saturninus TaxID=64648 RepID=A0A8H7V6Q0_9FUNG|nr:hypothetical protein INT47_007188 [Mucor saturninus]
MFVNLVTKLPNIQRLPLIGEMDLAVNFLDPIFTHVFRFSDSNKHLARYNDGGVTTKSRKCNIRLFKKLSHSIDPELAFINLVRLGTFARSLMLRKSNRKVLVIRWFFTWYPSIPKASHKLPGLGSINILSY